MWGKWWKVRGAAGHVCDVDVGAKCAIEPSSAAHHGSGPPISPPTMHASVPRRSPERRQAVQIAAAAAPATAPTGVANGSTPPSTAGTSAGGMGLPLPMLPAPKVWTGQLWLVTPTRSGSVHCFAESYAVPGRPQVTNLSWPTTLFVNSRNITAGTPILDRMRHPRVQWLIRFSVPFNGSAAEQSAARLEQLAAVLSAREQVLDVALEGGGILYLFGLPLSSLQRSVGASGGHVLLGAYLPPPVRLPKDVKVWNGTCRLSGFGHDAQFGVIGMRPHPRKTPTRTTCTEWPYQLILDRAKFVHRGQLPLQVPQAMWLVRIVPHYPANAMAAWHAAIAYVDAARLALEIPTSDASRSIVVTTGVVQGHGLSFVRVH